MFTKQVSRPVDGLSPIVAAEAEQVERTPRSLVTRPIRGFCARQAHPNDASVALHRRFGFRLVAHFSEQGRKFDRYWDVDWYERALG